MDSLIEERDKNNISKGLPNSTIEVHVRWMEADWPDWKCEFIPAFREWNNKE